MSEQTQTATIDVTDFRNAFLGLWKEIFDLDSGDEPTMVLDRGTSLFQTLEEISAQEASIPVSRQSSNLAAQVNHTAYYIQALRDGIATNFEAKADWDGSWKVAAVDEAQWQALIAKLRAEYEWVEHLAVQNDNWNEDYIGGAFALVAHAAYHLGEIRQGIGVIKSLGG